MNQLPNNNQLPHPVLLFDGVCNFCNGTVRLIIKIDPRGKFRFASLQSATGQRLLKQFHLPDNELNTVVLIEGGRAFTRSEVVFQVVRKVGGIWLVLFLFKIIPRPVRDAVYDWVARNRYKWFGRKAACPVPPAEVRERFLEG